MLRRVLCCWLLVLLPVWASAEDAIQRVVLDHVKRTSHTLAVRVRKVQVVGDWATADAVEVTEKMAAHQYLLHHDAGQWSVVKEGAPPLSAEKTGIPDEVGRKLGLTVPPSVELPPSPMPNPEALHYLCAASDVREIVALDLKGHSARELTLMRNEIFARHGRYFQNQELEDYFRAQPWYSPNPHYSDDLLSALEKRNAKYIEHYQEEHHLTW